MQNYEIMYIYHCELVNFASKYGFPIALNVQIAISRSFKFLEISHFQGANSCVGVVQYLNYDIMYTEW